MANEAVRHGFDGAADAYAHSRPAYPDEAVAMLLRSFGLTPGAHVVDLGAGTGIFSHHLAAQGLTITAVEPSAEMRAKIIASDHVTTHAGQAESTGLPDRSADAVVAATAWHWFDAERAIKEVRRILKPGAGGLGLLWNLYDESVAWVAEYADISYRRRPANSPSARDGDWRAFFDGLSGWEPLQEARFDNPQDTTPDRLIERLLSSSAIANLSTAEREDARQEAWSVLRRHGLAARAQVVLPYVTTLHWTKPSG
ncbi:class I SAM-dependent methyltransferase [Actinopolymorpha alba]|uniref:class I SAM-dependent methyltransferase n=1 Tax=Actinopolymorpha alba TaxID=533267 RepID=UPI0003636EEF|nr:class I SAM-dependent methyltransferase [Actinopolymorpha alba]